MRIRALLTLIQANSVKHFLRWRYLIRQTKLLKLIPTTILNRTSRVRLWSYKYANSVKDFLHEQDPIRQTTSHILISLNY
jgi:hypothetical protein